MLAPGTFDGDRAELFGVRPSMRDMASSLAGVVGGSKVPEEQDQWPKTYLCDNYYS